MVVQCLTLVKLFYEAYFSPFIIYVQNKQYFTNLSLQFLTIFIISSASPVLQRHTIKLEVKHLTMFFSNDQQCVGAKNIPNQRMFRCL